MALKVVRATPTELRTAASRVKAELTELFSELEALNGRVNQFCDVFEGQAATAFGDALEQWYWAVRGSTTTLDSLAEYLKSIADTLEQVDHALAGDSGGSV